MRLGMSLLTLLLAWIVIHQRITNPLDRCELIGHDAHWTTPTLRTCNRCPMTWRRDTGDIGATTTNQLYGW